MEGIQKMIKSIISKIKKLTGQNEVDNSKVVCGCFKVTEQDLKKAIKNGAKSFEEVQAVTKVGTGCGKCVESNKALVAQLLARK
jgi:NAD(P)H-nitrite reductase large subunit